MSKELETANARIATLEAQIAESQRQEPVAWIFSKGPITRLDTWPHGGKWNPLYLCPAPSDKDGEKWRWLRDNVKEIRYLPIFADQPDPTYIIKWVYELRDEFGASVASGHANESLDAAIDAAMKEEEG